MKEIHNGRGLWEWQIVTLIIGGSTAFFLFFFIYDGMTEEAVRKCIRATARVSVLSFSAAFGAAAFHAFFQNSLSWWLKMNRRYFGIAFAVMHILHLIFLALLQTVFHPVFDLAAMRSLTAGSLAYLFIFLMLFTSFEPFKSWLSVAQWRLLHTIGGWWIWGVYMSTNWKNVFRGNEEYLLTGLLLVFVGLARLWLLYLKKLKILPRT